MKEQLESKKDMNDFKIVIPMSDETIRKIKSNAAKAVLGASIAGVMIAGGQSVKAQSVQEPVAVVQTIDAQNENDKKELSLMIDEILTSKEKKTDIAKANEVPAVTMGVDRNASSDETSNADKGASSDETLVQEDQADDASENSKDITLNDFIKDDTLGELFDFNKIKADAEEKLDLEEEKTPEAQKAGEDKADTEPNYAEDEKKIKDYSEEERYRSSQMEQGAGTTDTSTDPSMESKDGFSYNTLEPSATSEDKTLWGIEIEFDKEKGQRTYTDFGFTNTGNLEKVLDTGNVSANEAGEKIAGGEKEPNYKSKSEIAIDGSRSQRNLNLYASEDDLKHINDKDNTNTTMAWQGKYLKDNPSGPLWATQGPSAAFSFTVNPWPNENDKLELIKLNGSHDRKEFVQGQTIETGVSVENLDDSARERLVGQVYHPLTGEVVPGAKAYINDQGKVVVKMPDGTINEDGSINENSIFYKDAKYKGIQNLEVKFFARPRTKREFEDIINNDEENFGTYTETGAGTKKIKHDGKEVEVDLQGIDRYDHYNLIGGFKLNLDDTRYYDQDFKDKNQDDTSKHTHSKVKPGEEFDVNLYVPTDKTDKDAFPNQKTPKEMEDAKDANQAIGSIDTSFIDQINKGKADEDKWVLEYDKKTLPTTLKITPPKSAKAGDFVAVPLTYTYTNGSTDVHWFHFVVQESDYIKPEYETQVNFPAKEQTSPATVKQGTKRIEPDHYTLPDTLETDEAGNKLVTDDSGNKWTVTLDGKTGKVSAKPVNPLDFNGGEKLTVPVISHYKDDQKPGEDITEETEAYFVIEEKADMTARYNAKAGKAGDVLSSDAILNTEDTYNRRPGKYTLDSDTFVDDKGNTWKVSIDENTGKVTATVPEGVPNDKLDGALLNVPVTAHYYEEDGTLEVGTKKTEVQFVATGAELNSPQYNVSIGDGNSEMTNSVIINADDKKDSPSSYTIDETKIYKDDKGNEWTVTIDPTTGEVKATPTDPSKLKGGEKLQVPVTAHYGDGDEAPTQNTTAEFVVKDKGYASPDYKAKVVKVGETQSADVKLTDGDNLKKPTKYTIENKTYTDDKGNTWTVSIDETTGKVTATAPSAEEGKELKLDGALLNVPVKAHYLDANGDELTRETSVQFIGTGTEGTHQYTEEIPFETKVEVVDDLEPGKWRYKKIDGVEQKGKNGSVTKEITIKDSKVEGKAKEIKREEPVKAIIEIGGQPVEDTKTVEKEVKTKIVYVEDDTLELGVVKEGTYTPGKVVTKVVYKFNPKTGKFEATEETTVTDAEQVIIKGIKKTENTCPAPDPDKPNPDKPSTENPGNPGGEEPGKPGGEEPGKPGGENPGNPGGEEPGNPGGDTPGTPGETTDKPNTPGIPDKPNTPDTPSEGGTTSTEEKTSEDPKDPEAKPETSVEKDKDPELNEETPVEKTEEAVENPELEKQNKINKTKQLPKTGDGMNRSFYGYTMGLIGSALLALGAKKKKNDTVDEK